MQNPNNFIVDSDYPFDMVAKVLSGSVTKHQPVGGGATVLEDYEKVSHGLNFTPLLSGFWSNTPDFERCYALGSTQGSYTADRGMELTECGANDKDIYMLLGGTVGGEIYYRIYCLVPGYLTEKVQLPQLAGFQNFTFNSDLAYMKIAKEGIVEANAGETITIPHDLGFVPFVRYWPSNGYDNTIFNVGGGRISDSPLTIGNADITFSMPYGLSNVSKLIYRIYADET